MYRLTLTINLDRHSKENLQSTVPDLVWAQDKHFSPGRTCDESSSSRLFPWNSVPENGQHCKHWCPYGSYAQFAMSSRC